MKLGVEYRTIEGTFQFLGGVPRDPFNNVNDFIDNRPTPHADQRKIRRRSIPSSTTSSDLPQDSWRASDRLTFKLGLRYDFVFGGQREEQPRQALFIEDNDFSSDPKNFYNADKNNFSPRLSAAYALDRTNSPPRRIRPLLRSRSVRGPHSAH